MLNSVWMRVVYLAMGFGLMGVQMAAAQPPSHTTNRDVLSFWEVVALQRYRAPSDLEDRRGHLGFYDSELSVARSQLTPIGVLKLGAAYTYTHFDFAGIPISVSSPQLRLRQPTMRVYRCNSRLAFASAGPLGCLAQSACGWSRART